MPLIRMSKSTAAYVLAIAVFVTLAVTDAAAGVVVISTFDTDVEGWVPHLNLGASVEYFSSGGNPGGHIAVNDVSNDWAYLSGPAKFLVPAPYNGTLSFDLKHERNGPLVAYKVRVGLVGNGLTLIDESVLPTTEWVNYAFTLNEVSSGWRKFSNLSQNYDTGAPLPTLSEFQGVLANLAGLFIATDYTDGNVLTGHIDRTYLDNVRIDTAAAAVPEPGSLTLLAVGLLGLLGSTLRTHHHNVRRLVGSIKALFVCQLRGMRV